MKNYIQIKLNTIILFLIITSIFVSCDDTATKITSNVGPDDNNILSEPEISTCLTDMSILNENSMIELNHSKLISKSKDNFIYLNNDNSKTIYLYSSPMLTDGGNIINNTLVEIDNIKENDQKYKYTTKENNVKTYFSSNPEKNGFLVTDEQTEMKIYKQAQIDTVKMQYYENVENFYGKTVSAIMYENQDGNNTIAYATQYGLSIEENISLDTCLNYSINIDNCTIESSCPEYLLFRRKTTDEVVAIVYAPFVKVNNTIILGKLDFSKVNSSYYNITCSFDFNKESIAKTQEVRMCQPFDLYTPKQPDSTVYEKTEIINNYLSKFMFTGAQNLRGSSQTYVRFEALESLDISADDIISAKYYVYCLTGATKNTTLKAYPVVDDWCSFTTNWMNKARPDTTKEIRPKALISNDYEFDITEIVKMWIKNRTNEKSTYSIRNGIVLIDTDNSSSEVLATNDNGNYNTVLVLKIK